jgi:hypothetical protein
MRGAALNLSNMENLEWLSGQPLLLDEKHPALIGPVINSKRQLWSVGAYLGMVIENVFGLSTSAGGIELRPFITAKLRREVFGTATAPTLDGLALQGRRIKITLQLPPASIGNGYYAVDEVRLNGAKAGQAIAWDKLPADSAIILKLGALQGGQQAIARVRADPYSPDARAVFAPREPGIASLTRDAAGKPKLAFDIAGNHSPTLYNIYRDGRQVASGLNAASLAKGWADREGGPFACYAAEAQYADSGNRSHHSPARCMDAGIEIAAAHKNWGKPGEQLEMGPVDIAKAGSYQLQLRYYNGANEINLGISGGVKWLAVKDQAGKTVAQGVLQMPHTRARPKRAHLFDAACGPPQTRPVPLVLGDFYNMSYLQSNSSFSAAGGTSGPSNQFDMYGVRICASSEARRVHDRFSPDRRSLRLAGPAGRRHHGARALPEPARPASPSVGDKGPMSWSRACRRRRAPTRSGATPGPMNWARCMKPTLGEDKVSIGGVVQAGRRQHGRHLSVFRGAVRQGRHRGKLRIPAAGQQPRAAHLPAAELCRESGQALPGAVHARRPEPVRCEDRGLRRRMGHRRDHEPPGRRRHD